MLYTGRSACKHGCGNASCPSDDHLTWLSTIPGGTMRQAAHGSDILDHRQGTRLDGLEGSQQAVPIQTRACCWSACAPYLSVHSTTNWAWRINLPRLFIGGGKIGVKQHDFDPQPYITTVSLFLLSLRHCKSTLNQS